MSRTDGVFPKYTKLDISLDDWPKGYWDKSRECSLCGTKWPHPHIFEPSVCCEEPTNLVEAPPDSRWPEAVAQLLTARFDKLYDEYNEGLEDDQLTFADEAKIEVEELVKEVQHH